MQSERMYAALKGLGKDTRLVMLPYEAHGYRARKSLLHVLWEQEQWLDKYLLSDTAEPIKATSEQVTELTPSK
ncbi:hypothetical protein B0W48_03270 [Pseudoalteromonas aliena]|uniref:Peptidase S9 prolyl oligopeptidase catalytic domain-containing protein n=1 Tax=Pseudoalteromonas aliena TaxID=247523 RepID=A0A1Q2GUV2_9GAMM|nr:hypothetical protein [Pseudoalteromonas aliena]AQP98903.1 hypothetical protein B0W48_03270 [Pseudoalteromonas aliena]